MLHGTAGSTARLSLSQLESSLEQVYARQEGDKFEEGRLLTEIRQTVGHGEWMLSLSAVGLIWLIGEIVNVEMHGK